MANGAEVACLRGHEGSVWSVAFSPDGARIVSGSFDRTVRVWNTSSATSQACLRGHKSAVTSVAFSPDGTRIVSGSNDRTVRVWDSARGTEMSCLNGHEYGITSVAFSPDGTRIISGAIDNTLRIWDAKSGACLEIIHGNSDVAAISTGTERLPFHVLEHNTETVVVRTRDGKYVAIFPTSFEQVTTDALCRTWAGAHERLVDIITLEGEA